jgi:type I restriction enzyme S subunit
MNAPDRLANLRVNPERARLPLFDRTGWRRMPFGDFANSVNERVEPADAADEPYVGLDDLDSGDLHIRRWGKGSDVIGTKLRFRKGDIIFGRRRAYQRKLAVAEFDGICSAHAMVVRAKPNAVLPAFLPFMMMSDRFMKRAVEISVGSLSPTINWTTLKLEEFDLPPLEQQRRFAKVFAACDDNLQGATQLFERAAQAKTVQMERETQFKHATGRLFPRRPMEEVISLCQYGISTPLAASGTYPVLRMMNYDGERVAHTDMAYADVDADIFKEFRVKRGDILFNRTNSADLVGKVGIFDLTGDYLFASYLVRLRTNSKVMIPEFLNFFLNSVSGQRAVRAFATPGVSQSNISAGNLKKVTVPVPDLQDQEAIVQSIMLSASNTRRTREHAQTARDVTMVLANAIFAGVQ